MKLRLSRFRLTALTVLAAVLIAAGFTAFDVVPAATAAGTLQAWQVDKSDDLMRPWSGLWGDVKATSIVLSAQNVTKPFGGGEVPTLKARALQDGTRLYVMLEWNDSTVDDTVNGQTVFADAAAMELPTVAGVAIPSFCMGDATGTVNVWHWKAAWQRDLDSGHTAVRDRYPDGFTDTDPLANDPVYQTAAAAGNLIAQLNHVSPIENLVAGGFGTLTTGDVQDVAGKGEWKDGRWRVVFSRPLTTSAGYPSMAVGDVTNVAFAVWDGSKGNRNGLKSVSQFVNLQVSASAMPATSAAFPWWGWAIGVAILVTFGAGLATAYYGGKGKTAS